VRRFAIYARVSREEKGRPDHVSLDHQLDACRRYVEAQGGSVAFAETDVQSGLDPHRPAYQRILGYARAGRIDAAACWRFDRWGRDHVEAFLSFRELRDLGIEVLSASEPHTDTFVRDLFLLLANRESQTISLRVKPAMRLRASVGQWQGRPPLGYRLVGAKGSRRLSPGDKAPLVRRLFELAATGSYSMSSLRRE